MSNASGQDLKGFHEEEEEDGLCLAVADAFSIFLHSYSFSCSSSMTDTRLQYIQDTNTHHLLQQDDLLYSMNLIQQAHTES